MDKRASEAVPGTEFTCRALEDAYAAVLDAAIERLHELRLDIVRPVRMAEVPLPLHLAAGVKTFLQLFLSVPRPSEPVPPRPFYAVYRCDLRPGPRRSVSYAATSTATGVHLNGRLASALLSHSFLLRLPAS